MPERSSAPRQENPLFGKGSREFDQFGSMQGEMRGDPDAFEPAVENLVSLTQGYQLQSSARSGKRKRLQRKSTLQPFPE